MLYELRAESEHEASQCFSRAAENFDKAVEFFKCSDGDEGMNPLWKVARQNAITAKLLATPNIKVWLHLNKNYFAFKKIQKNVEFEHGDTKYPIFPCVRLL